ncbi:GNAT family N-acetyltransferase [Pseudalkalibacillus hwajinpoensis]|uniref:GNAT family N-acetyltransferase n=1 Tax=Guptibacillus hwajinpoensis TaxID=208199 RepID=UPI00325A50CD
MEADYQLYDGQKQKTISFTRVDYDRDIEVIHKWMNEEHVHPFWHLNLPIEPFRNHLRKALNDPHHTLYLGLVNNIPISYWEAYWVKGDITEEMYESIPYDQGIHLLIGEKNYLGKGLSLPLLHAMVAFQFEEKRTKRIIAEPDIRNEKMIHVFEKCGFASIKPIELPDKTGLLMICDRDQFERKWLNVSAYL